MDVDALKAWTGRTETRTDVVTAAPVRMLRATLDLPPDESLTTLPPLWHWLYFLPSARESELGPDGHPRRGGFLPPVPLPRRMWAGGQLELIQPLRLGDVIKRQSTIDDVTVKSGRNGELCFVRVRHEVSSSRGLALREFHDIVYRPNPLPGAPVATGEPAPDATWSERIVPDDVLLFRYSALTFNGHRIHYDRRYVTTEEGYPGLIVHGPLIATYLMELYRANDSRVLSKFSFRAISPSFDIAPFKVQGKPTQTGATLWAAGDDGSLRMEATAEWRA